MDIGPVSRELAPQKLKRDPKKPIKAKAMLRVPVTKNVKGQNLIDSEYYDHLFNHDMFHHMLGLSSLKKTLMPTLRELHLPDGFEFEDDEDSFTKEQSYDHSQIMQSKHSRKERSAKNASSSVFQAGASPMKSGA